jgi:hypothetical protein
MHYSKCKWGYVLRPEIGEEIQDALRQFAQKVEIKGAFYSGIGALMQVELAFFCRNTKSYERRFLNGDYEMISLTGNLTHTDGMPTPHSHVCLADRQFHTFSGHLVRGIVSVTAEILVIDVDLPLIRKDDPVLQYKGLISPDRVHLRIES